MIRGRRQEAAQEFREALRIVPNDAATWNNLGMMLLEQGNLDGAEQALTGALRLQTLPLEQGNLDGAEQALTGALRLQTLPLDVRINMGVVSLRRGQLKQAEHHLLEALASLQLARAVALNNLGMVLATQGRSAEAEQAFKEAVALDPRYADARRNLGLAYLEKGQMQAGILEQPKQAEHHLLAALASLQLARAVALNNLGMVLATQGRSAEAEQAFKEAVALDPRYADARRNLGLAYLEKGQMQAGILELEEAVRYKGADPTLHHLLGEAYHVQGQQDRAVASLRKALSLKGDLAEARELLDSILHSPPD
jgi:Tfp pilus assembly protein PilF